MQATALAFDVLLEPGTHAVLMRQVYNKTRSYLEWMAARIGASVTIVDDGDRAALAEAIRPNTRFVFAETFTNPLVRAQDFDMLREVIDARAPIAPALKLVLDTTIASPWAFKQSAPRQRRRHRRRQRHQVAGRQRSRPVGLPRDQRHAVRQRGDGPDGDARRHSRLAAGRRDCGGVRSGRAIRMRAGRRQRRRLPHSSRRIPGSARSFIRRCPVIRTRRPSADTTFVMARCCRSASRTRMRSARAISPTCWRRR